VSVEHFARDDEYIEALGHGLPVSVDKAHPIG